MLVVLELPFRHLYRYSIYFVQLHCLLMDYSWMTNGKREIRARHWQIQGCGMGTWDQESRKKGKEANLHSPSPSMVEPSDHRDLPLLS